MPLARRSTGGNPQHAPHDDSHHIQSPSQGLERGSEGNAGLTLPLSSPDSGLSSGKTSLDQNAIRLPFLGSAPEPVSPTKSLDTSFLSQSNNLAVPKPPLPSTSSSQTVVDELETDPFRSSPKSISNAKLMNLKPAEPNVMTGAGVGAAQEKPHPGLHHDQRAVQDRPGIMRNRSAVNTHGNDNNNNTSVNGSAAGLRGHDPEKGLGSGGDAGGHKGGALGAFKERFSNKNALKGSGVVPKIIGEKDFADDNPTTHTHAHNSNNRARFEKEPGAFDWTLKETWARVKQRLRNPSHPSSSSQLESALGEDSVSAMGSHRPRNPRSVTGGTSVGRSPSNCQGGYEDDEIIGSGDRGMTEPVSVVAVESDLRQFVPAAKSDNGSAANTGSVVNNNQNNNTTQYGANGSSHRPDTDGSTTQPSWVARMAQGGSFGMGDGAGRRKNGDDGSSIRRDRRTNVIKRTWLYEMIAERAWPVVAHFCDSKFPEPSKEKSYLKEVHFTLRRGAICASLFYVISWILTAALQAKPYGPIGAYGYILATGIFIVPLPLLVIFDLVKTRPFFYQAWLWCATWGFSIIVLVDMYDCGFYSDHRNCGKKDFLGLFYWGLSLPVLSILALGAKRSWHIFGMTVWAALVIALILVGGSPALMYRNFVNFLLFHGFLLMVSYLKEKSDRQLFSLRTQLKLQYRATQQAQISEKKANALSRRFVSYIFHEVRVPLNTALLAVQNLENEGVYDAVDKDQRDMVDGLQASLTMMEKVLNDVLSFNRMESGKFTQSRKPFDLHKSVQLVVLSHNAQAQASGLYLKAELDPEIDKLGGTFISDEMRLRQVVSNLVSNAAKFTPSGGITVTTKLLWPRLAEFTPLDENPTASHHDSITTEKTLNGDDANPFAPYQKDFVRGSNDKAIIRVEIKDTGIGLSPKDTKRGALFSPYVQTEIGRRQGGKGTGLGLALCMQIVKLMGGRMGVDSQLGVGSTFWFELALLLPPPSSHPVNLLPLPEPSRGLKDHPPVHISDKAYLHTTEPPAELEPPRPPFLQVQTPSSPGEVAETPDSQSSAFKPPYELLPYQKHMKAENVFDAIEEQVHTEVMHQQYPTFTPIVQSDEPSYEESETSTVFRKQSDASYAFRKGSDAQSMAGAMTPAITPMKHKTKDGLPPLHCLVVDDDNMTRKLMCRMLQKMGHQTDQAENGKLALEMVRQRHFREVTDTQYDMIFLDNQMPVMTGVECARELRSFGCPIFICGATGNALQDDQTEYLDAGADRILTKPIKQASMIEAMGEARLRVAGDTKPKGARTEQLSDELLGSSIPPPITP